MKTASPLGQGGTSGGFGAVTDNLVWVVDPEPHPGASRHTAEGGDFQRVGADLWAAIPRRCSSRRPEADSHAKRCSKSHTGVETCEIRLDARAAPGRNGESVTSYTLCPRRRRRGDGWSDAPRP
jgi:hypothetical protein